MTIPLVLFRDIDLASGAAKRLVAATVTVTFLSERSASAGDGHPRDPDDEETDGELPGVRHGDGRRLAEGVLGLAARAVDPAGIARVVGPAGGVVAVRGGELAEAEEHPHDESGEGDEPKQGRVLSRSRERYTGGRNRRAWVHPREGVGREVAPG